MHMIQRWLHNMTLPSNIIQREQAPTLQLLLLGLIGAACIAIWLTLVLHGPLSMIFVVLCVWLLIFSFGLWLLRRGLFSASLACVSIGLLVGIFVIMMPDGVRSLGLNFMLLNLPLILAGLLGSRRLLWFIALGSIVLYITLGVLGILIPTMVGYRYPNERVAPGTVIAFSIVISLIAISVDRFSSKLRSVILRGLEREEELERLRSHQEKLVAERTAELRTALAQVEQREQQLSQTLAYLRSAQDKVRELSLPVLPVLPRVLTIPLVGEIDEARANVLMKNTLAVMEREPVQHFIFDLTSVANMQENVAAILVKTADALKLMDARVLLVGVQPKVAETMASLGRERNIFSIHPDLRSAISSLIPDR